MTDMEEDPTPSNLDSILEAWAGKEYANAKLSGDEKKYFADSVKSVITDFRLPHAVYHNIMNFAADRYIFHRRHKELARHDAKRETCIDTYKYLLELKNDMDVVSNDRPRLRDQWR